MARKRIRRPILSKEEAEEVTARWLRRIELSQKEVGKRMPYGFIVPCVANAVAEIIPAVLRTDTGGYEISMAAAELGETAALVISTQNAFLRKVLQERPDLFEKVCLRMGRTDVLRG